MAAAQHTYRVQHHNISNINTTHTSRLLQGGVRWQMLTLSSHGDLVLSNVGLIPSEHFSSKSQGAFECSNSNWTNIWKLGAATVAGSMIAANSIPEFWQIQSEGAYIESAAPQPYAGLQAQALTSYEMNFTVMPVVGGFSFKVLSDTLGDGIYIWVDLTKATITAFDGSTEAGIPLAHASLNGTAVVSDRWCRVSASVDLSRVDVYIDGVSVLAFSQTSKYYGSFGLGAANGQSALFTNLSVTSAGANIYSSNLTSESALEDFLVGTNPLNMIVDGARRDRIAYAGDLDVAARTVATSNFQLEYINNTIQLLASNQMDAGFFVPTVKIQQSPRTELINVNQTGLIAYSFSLLSAMGEYVLVSGDIAAAKAYAPAATRMLDWAASQRLPNGLFNLSDASFGGDWDYYDPARSGVVTKFNVVYALALQEVIPMLAVAGTNTSSYRKTLEDLRVSIDAHLYSNTSNAYMISASQTQGIAQDANAMAILADIPRGTAHSKHSVSQAMAAQLFVSHGALPFSNSTPGVSKIISPFASSYHLRAAFVARDASSAKHLLNNLWTPMTLQTAQNYSGCFWEAVSLDGKPGLGDGTLLCHAWSSGPTAELTRHVLGIQAVTPGFREWRVVPQSLGLDWARGNQPTPFGDIAVDWRYDEDGLVSMDVSAPPGTKGTVSLPPPVGNSTMNSTIVTIVNGRIVKGHEFEVDNGEQFKLSQFYSASA